MDRIRKLTPVAQAKMVYFAPPQAWGLQTLKAKQGVWGMIRFLMLVAVFLLMMITNLQRAHASEEMNLTLCSKWVADTDAVTTFTCSKNGKTYATGLSFCTNEKSQSTVEEMISDIRITRLFCKPEWSESAFECSKDETAETAACAEEFKASFVSGR